MWGLHVFAAAAVAVTVVMGLWQLGVYDTRQADEQTDREQARTVPLQEVLGPDEAFTAGANHRPVWVEGHYASAGQQFWVSGREHDGESGYWLVAPFLVEDVPADQSGRESALLVVRGWAPDNGELAPTPSGPVRLRTVLEASEASSSGLDDARTTGSIRIPALVGELPYDLYSAYGIVTGPGMPAEADLAPVAPPAPESSWTVGWRNLVYAIQWWVFGAFAAFMWWRMASEMVGKAQDRAGDAAGRTVS